MMNIIYFETEFNWDVEWQWRLVFGGLSPRVPALTCASWESCFADAAVDYYLGAAVCVVEETSRDTSDRARARAPFSRN